MLRLLAAEANEYLNLPDEAAYQARRFDGLLNLYLSLCKLPLPWSNLAGCAHAAPCLLCTHAAPANSTRTWLPFRPQRPCVFSQELGRTICMLGASAAPLLEERFYAGGDAAVLALAAITQTTCSDGSAKQAAVQAFWNSTSVWNATNAMK